MHRLSVLTRDTRPRALTATLKVIATTATQVDPSIETLVVRTEEIINVVERGVEIRVRTGKGSETVIVIVTGIELIEVLNDQIIERKGQLERIVSANLFLASLTH